MIVVMIKQNTMHILHVSKFGNSDEGEGVNKARLDAKKGGVDLKYTHSWSTGLG